MDNMKKSIRLLGMAACFSALLGGCATTEELNQAKATADQALRTANEAKASAASARSVADQAAEEARLARAESAEAKRIAVDAKEESSRTSEKLDRMFKKTMQK